jgi:hypothetical protein
MTMTTKNPMIHTNPPGNRADWLALAINHLDADEHERGFVYRDDATRKLYVTTERDLVLLGKMLARLEPDAYSYWCTMTDGLVLVEETDEDETED